MILAIVGVILCQVLLFSLALILANRLKSSLIKNVRLYFEAPEEGKQSPFADILDLIAARFAHAITASIKGSLLNLGSQTARQQNAIQGELIKQSAPIGIQALLSQFPGLRKIITKNPELAEYAMNAFAKRSTPADGEDNHKQYYGSPFKV